MSQRLTQKLVNQKCDILRSQNEEITINKVRKFIDQQNICITDLVEKVTLYKQDNKQALTNAIKEQQPIQKKTDDDLLKIIRQTFKQFSVEKDELVLSFFNKLKKYLNQEIVKSCKKLKQEQIEISNNNHSLEISNLVLDKRFNELLEKYNQLKDEFYNLKQEYNSNSMGFLQQQKTQRVLLAWEDFKSVKKQFSALAAHTKVAGYDKTGVIAIKFPATDFLTKECRAGVSNHLKAKTVFDYNIQAWILHNLKDILKTADFLKRNKFIFSEELETIIHLNKPVCDNIHRFLCCLFNIFNLRQKYLD